MSVIARAAARLRALDPSRVDALMALLVLVETQVEALALGTSGGARLEAHVIGVACAAVVLLHRRRVWVAFLGAQLLFVVGQSAGAVITEGLYAPLFVFVFINVSAAAQISGRAFWLVPPIAAVTGTVSLWLDSYDDDLTSYVWTLVFFAGATTAGGRLLDSRARLSQALREKARRAEVEEAERAEQAMLDERARIAGELHDIIAHALSGMVVQASAARRLTDTDPDRARGAFSAVEHAGRDALGELRRLLGVLRRDDEELARAPAPSLAHLDALIRRVTASGLPVRLAVEGDPRPLPAGVDVAAFRVIQSALGAALELGGAGRAEVVVRYRPGDVEVEVRDDGTAGVDDPRRLMGMRERVGLFGGELRVGRPRDGGHELLARLPVTAGAVA